MNKPKVTKIAFADGKAVRFRQEVEQMVVEYKMPGKSWVAIEPIALEPFVPANMSEMTNEALDDVAQRTGMSRDMVGAYYGLSRVHGGVSDDLSGIGRGEGAINRVRPRITPRVSGDVTRDDPVWYGSHPIRLETGDRIGIDLRTSSLVPDDEIWVSNGRRFQLRGGRVVEVPSIEEGGADGTGVH